MKVPIEEAEVDKPIEFDGKMLLRLDRPGHIVTLGLTGEVEIKKGIVAVLPGGTTYLFPGDFEVETDINPELIGNAVMDLLKSMQKEIDDNKK